MTQDRRITDKLPGQPLLQDFDAPFDVLTEADFERIWNELGGMDAWTKTFGYYQFGFHVQDAIIERLAAPQAGAGKVEVPEGWKLVPTKPTKEMRDAAFLCWAVTSGAAIEEIYSTMLAASPAAPVAKIEHITINGHQLKQALDLTWPDGDADPMQGETVVNITRWPAGKASDEFGGLVDRPAGLYLDYDDLPAEGMTYLPEEPEEGAAPVASQPAQSEQQKGGA